MRVDKEIPHRLCIAPRVLALPQVPASPATSIPPGKVAPTCASSFKSLEATIRNNAAIPHRERCFVAQNPHSPPERISTPYNPPRSKSDDSNMSLLPNAYNIRNQYRAIETHC